MTVLPAIIFFAIFFVVSIAKSKKSAAAKPQRPVQPRPRPTPPENNSGTEFRPTVTFNDSPDCSDSIDDEGFDSASEYHEGEDPCHDGMYESQSEAMAKPAPPAANGIFANELVKGVVFNEILSRKYPSRPKR